MEPKNGQITVVPFTGYKLNPNQGQESCLTGLNTYQLFSPFSLCQKPVASSSQSVMMCLSQVRRLKSTIFHAVEYTVLPKTYLYRLNMGTYITCMHTSIISYLCCAYAQQSRELYIPLLWWTSECMQAPPPHPLSHPPLNIIKAT